MPRLLRRAAPSPSVDELAFATSAPSLTATMSFSDGHKCALHGNLHRSSSSSGRRPSLHRSETADTENSSGSSSGSDERDSSRDDDSVAATAAAAAAEVDAERSSAGGLSMNTPGSFCCTCVSTTNMTRSRASQGSSKRLSTRLDDLAATVVEDASEVGGGEFDTDDNESCCSHEADATCPKCEMLHGRESVSSSASSRVVIRDTQLAALDMEIQNLRKTFVKSVYERLTSMSRRLGKRNGAPQLTAS